MERGFKTWAERTAVALRKELGVDSSVALPVPQLAVFLDVRLWTPHDVPGLPDAMRSQLLVRDPGGWSAVACVVDGKCIIIHNPQHSPARQASNIVHELAHIILDHEPGKIVLSQDGGMMVRSYDEKEEEEANWLGWCLLLPRESLVLARKARLTTAQVAVRFGVSEQLVTYRTGITGINAQFRGTKRSPARR